MVCSVENGTSKPDSNSDWNSFNSLRIDALGKGMKVLTYSWKKNWIFAFPKNSREHKLTQPDFEL